MISSEKADKKSNTPADPNRRGIAFREKKKEKKEKERKRKEEKMSSCFVPADDILPKLAVQMLNKV